MKRRPQSRPEPVVPAEILERAKESVSADKLKKSEKCVVCGGESSGLPDELCWVCRRLKISAWRETEQQMPVQE